MLRLHGTTHGTRVPMVHTALGEKGLPFEFVAQESGDAPTLETEDGMLTDTLVILDYLEAVAPEPALVPPMPFARARLQALTRSIERCVQLPAGRLLPAAPEDAKDAAELRASVAAELDRGLLEVRSLAAFEPWLAGAAFTQADIVWHFTLELAGQVARTQLDRDLVAEIPAAAAHREAVEARPSVQRWRRLS